MSDNSGLPWEPTMELRFACEGTTGFKLLQQKWVRHYSDEELDGWTFEEEWRQVPFVDVSQEDSK